MKRWKKLVIVALPIALAVFLIAAPVVPASGNEALFPPSCTSYQRMYNETQDCITTSLPISPYLKDYNFSESVSYYLLGVGTNQGVLQCHFRPNSVGVTGFPVACVNEGYKFVWGEPICRSSQGNQSYPAPCQ